MGTEAARRLPFVGTGEQRGDRSGACTTHGNVRMAGAAPTTLGGFGSLRQGRIEAQ